MGLIKLSGLLTDLGGKFNGSVIQRNKAGIIMRNNHWKAPQNFPKWQAQKSAFAVLAATWRTLTQIQRDAWNTAGALYPATNRFGDVYTPSGFQLYTTLNGTLQAAGQALLLVPLIPDIVFDQGANTLLLTVFPTFTVDITNTIPIDNGIQIYASRPLSAGSGIRDGSFSLMLFEDDPIATSFDITVAYLAKFGLPPAGSRVYSKVESIRKDTGQSGNLRFATDIMP